MKTPEAEVIRRHDTPRSSCTLMDIEAIEEVSEAERNHIAEKGYGTTDSEHPGVDTLCEPW